MNNILMNTDDLINRSTERKLVDKMNKNLFFKWMEKCSDFDIGEMHGNKKFTNEELKEFNDSIKRASEALRISLLDLIQYIEEIIQNPNKIIRMLDDENKEVVKNELAYRHNIKIEETNLSDIVQ